MAITKPSPYVPSFLRAAMSGSRPLTLTWADVADTNIASSASFQYESHATPLKSTQQLNVDWSQFQNHTFFMSAEAKVNLAFDAIINGFPFDGTRQETEVFFDNLTGFDRWIFDSFPRYRGQLAFSGCTGGTGVNETGTFVSVQNKAGALFPELSRTAGGQPVLNPTGSQSLTIEMQVYLPTTTNDVQVVCQMLSGTSQGFTLYLTSSASTSSCGAYFAVVSGSSHMVVPVTLSKGVFNHVAVTLNRDSGLPYLQAFYAASLAASSPAQTEMGDLDIDGCNLLIGSGTSFVVGNETVNPTSTFSGSLDEFRVFHSSRSAAQQAAYARKSLFATPDLVAYYRFNEPSGSFDGTSSTTGINSIVLDSSGNSLHSLVTNFAFKLRQDASLDPLNPIVYENVDTTPVLFPSWPATVSLNQELLASASTYDQENPNLITKLVPQHYLLEGAAKDGFEDPEGLGGAPYSGTGVPGQGQLGSVQVMVSLLYIWARFFDEVKLFVDSFSTLRTVDYVTDETVPDNFLLDVVKSMGFNLPPLFNDSTLEQYVRGENIDIQSITTSDQTLRQVQNTLLRRVLVNLPDVLRSKGTQHSIKSFLRAVGIDPGNNVRIREFGGPTTQQLSFSRESKIEPNAMVQFTSASFAMTPYLSASRTEPGYPWTTSTPNDGLLTSGSWTWEGIVKYTPSAIDLMTSATQSLARLCVTGSLSGTVGSSVGFVANLLAVSSSVDPKLVLYLRSGDASGTPVLRLELETPTPGIFNHDRWNVSFGCHRGDDGLASPVSSSYFLRLGYQNSGKVEYLATTSSFFQAAPVGNDVLRTLGTGNASGSFLAIGTNQFIDSGSGFPFLNDTGNSSVPVEARTTDFNGRLSNVRFWSRALTVDEWTEHVRNYNSTGVEDPLTNWNYATSPSGSFGRLRLNSLTRQEVVRANGTASLGPTGSITFIDYSENGFHFTGSNFPIDSDCVVGELFDMSYLSPYFDEATNDEKIRARSYQAQDLVDATPWASTAPVYEIVPSEQPTDDVRFIIEFSLIDALNRDIVTMFSTLDAIDNALGAPELIFSPDYPDLELLRNVYFNRIKQRLNFQAFFEFFRWFDTSIGTFIQQLVPRKTRFKGTNFTIESHMLERAKQEYRSSEIYLGDSIRQNLDAVILLQQVEGTIRKL